MSTRFPGMKFSFRRLLIAIFVGVAILIAFVIGVTYQIQVMKPLSTPWTGGYVDVTETPTFDFESRTGPGEKNLVLAFIVSSGGRCEPSWGNYYTLSEADTSLDLDRRIAQVQKSGRTAVLSFGGANNSDLATACDTSSATAKAMADAIGRYNIDTIDLDIEGSDLSDAAGRERRAEAVLELQSQASRKGKGLAVWLTLPADRHGLTNEGMATVHSFLAAGVTLSGVNLMTMNFGVPSTETSMAALSEEALTAAHGQFTRLLLASGRMTTAPQVWTMLGATPMIGQNDESDESFSPQDAVHLQSFAQSKNLGRLSFWSLNRDRQCDANYTDWNTAVNFCSGVGQDPLQFDAIFSAERDGSAFQIPDKHTVGPAVTPQSGEVQDDPATSPFQVWNAGKTYVANEKVVWKRNVYVALWTNRDSQPDQTDATGGIAWRLVGPVLDGEAPRPQPTLPAGTYREWDPETIYDVGDRVMYDTVAYEAKWWTQGDSPAARSSADASPWRVLTEAEIAAVKAANGNK